MIEISNVLLKGESMLLPVVHDIFKSIFHTRNLQYKARHICNIKMVIKPNNKTLVMKHHVSFVCKVWKHGTIYRQNQDHFLTISHLLSKVRNKHNYVFHQLQQHTIT